MNELKKFLKKSYVNVFMVNCCKKKETNQNNIIDHFFSLIKVFFLSKG